MKILGKESLRWLVALLIATILGILQLFSAQLFGQAKKVGYRFIAFYPLVRDVDDLANNLKVQYRDRQINNLDAILLEVTNDGSQPIKREDFDSEVIISFDESTAIIDAAVSKTFPDRIPAKIEVEANRLLLRPVLLNPADKIVIKILVSGSHSLPTVTGRIAGIKEIEEQLEYTVEYPRTTFSIWSAGVSGVLLFILAFSFASLCFLPSSAIPAISRWELFVWMYILTRGGHGLLGFWGENVNFTLSKWMNLTILFVFGPLLILGWYRFRLMLYRKFKESQTA